jgi:4,5-dihydroxyphthalate decarboxylase
MPDIHLSMATSGYDHFRDVLSGRVRPEGIELTTMELPVEDIFFRTFSFAEWDIAEFSMAKYVAMIGAGTAPFRAIPVFPSRVFRQSAFYIRADNQVHGAKDFVGRRIGVPEWGQTAGIYARGFLQHQCGVRLSDVHWVQAGVNQAGRTEKIALSLPEGVQIEQIKDRSLNDMLLSGDLDAIISAREPASFLSRDSRIVRLWPDSQSIEEGYYRETGIFPIMHVVVIKNDVLARHPWVATNLLRAFEEAKANSLRRLSSIVHSSIPVPWFQEAYDHARQVFGDDFWPYGIQPNRLTLDKFLQFCQEQGVLSRKVSVEELFPVEVSKEYRV